MKLFWSTTRRVFRGAMSCPVIMCCTLLLCSGLVIAGDEEVKLDSKNEKLQEMVRDMLGFKESLGVGSMPHPPNPKENAPQYMLDLYKKFKDNTISKGQLTGNTVRSIHAKTDKVHDEAMFVFNLSSVLSSEQIISAEIHFYKRRKLRFNRKADLELILHEVAPRYTKDSSKLTIKAESYGWQWFDVTEAVKSCLSKRRSESHHLALNFKRVKPSGKVTVLDLKRFSHHHSLPFLVVYSNDDQHIDVEEMENMATKFRNKESETKTEGQSNLSSKQRTPSRNKRSIKDNTADGVYQASRSIFTNEIPEDPDDYQRFPIDYNFKSHPGILQARRESRHKLQDPRLIPYPAEKNKKKNRRKNRRKLRKNKKNKSKKGKRKNQLDLPKDWDDLQNVANGDSGSKLCGKKLLVVDFNKIGWGEWVIAPKSFEAHYCAGRCPFPLTKRLRPSNHATIQSLVHSAGIYPDVPAPCCVPDTLSSLSLLYFDENKNVVLKNYLGMSVETCACR